MRSLFPGYYRPTADEFEELWRDGQVVFDTNVLLNLYRYGPSSRQAWFRVLHKIKERLWIPYQVAEEFQEARIGVIEDQKKRYDELRDLLGDIRKRVDNSLAPLSRHPLLEPDRVTAILEPALAKVEEYVAQAQEQHTEFADTSQLVESDPIRAELDKLLEDRIGPRGSSEDRAAKEKLAEERLQQQIPPGYRDAAKDGPRSLGDGILWLQVLDHAQESQRPVVLVTDDRKDDWWWTHQGRTLGPRPELTAEMRETCDVLFYLYSPDRFLQWASQRLELRNDEYDAAITETERVSTWQRKSQQATGMAHWYEPENLEYVSMFLEELHDAERNIELVELRLADATEALHAAVADMERLEQEHPGSPMLAASRERVAALEHRRAEHRAELERAREHHRMMRREIAELWQSQGELFPPDVREPEQLALLRRALRWTTTGQDRP